MTGIKVMAQRLPAGASITWQMHTQDSWEHNGACNTVHTTSLLYRVKDSNVPKDLLLAFTQAIHRQILMSKQEVLGHIC